MSPARDCARSYAECVLQPYAHAGAAAIADTSTFALRAYRYVTVLWRIFLSSQKDREYQPPRPHQFSPLDQSCTTRIRQTISTMTTRTRTWIYNGHRALVYKKPTRVAYMHYAASGHLQQSIIAQPFVRFVACILAAPSTELA